VLFSKLNLIFKVVQDQESANIFSNVESFSAILKCFHRSKTSDDALWIASSINNIFYFNPSSNILFNSLPIVEAFSFIIPLAKDDETVHWISDILRKILRNNEEILRNNEEAQKKFGTADFLVNFQKMEKHATTDQSKKSFRSVLGFVDPIDYSKPFADATNSSQLASAVDSLPRNEKYFTEKVRDLLFAKKDLIVDAETADSVVKFLFSFSLEKSIRPLLQLREIHDLIINHIAPHVTAIYHFGGFICEITCESKPSAELFSNVESFSAILKCFHRSKTSDDARWIASSINNILHNNPPSNKLLNSLPIVEAFSFIITLANDSESVYWISETLMKILKNNEESQKKFSIPEFFQIFQGMEKQAKTQESKYQIEKVVQILKLK
jgi:hypothetical protein